MEKHWSGLLITGDKVSIISDFSQLTPDNVADIISGKMQFFESNKHVTQYEITLLYSYVLDSEKLQRGIKEINFAIIEAAKDFGHDFTLSKIKVDAWVLKQKREKIEHVKNLEKLAYGDYSHALKL